jgi:hypothetical protein
MYEGLGFQTNKTQDWLNKRGYIFTIYHKANVKILEGGEGKGGLGRVQERRGF